MILKDLFGSKTTTNDDINIVGDPMPLHVHNLIILDQSGSMHSIYGQALNGVNETLKTIRAAQTRHPEQFHTVSLLAFNSCDFSSIYKNTPAGKAVNITSRQYRPNAGTPLYDAMGTAINELRQCVEGNDVVLVTVITDGEENSSQEYSGKAVKALVDSLKKEGWVFTYIGANQDVEAVSSSLSIDNCLAFEATQQGAAKMFRRESRHRASFYDKLCEPDADLSVGYFADDSEESSN